MAAIVTLLIVGVLLLVSEIFLPGMIAGLIGLICLIGAVLIGFTQYGVNVGASLLGVVIFGLLIGFMLWLKYFPDSSMAKIFVSHGAIGEIGTDRPHLLNQQGTTLTDLRPSGTATINEQRVDVVSEGSHISKGTNVKVVAVEGLRVVVRQV